MRTLFGTDGIRGKARTYPLDRATMFALGESLAHRLRKITANPEVLMTMDTRESGKEIAAALAAGMRAGGATPILIGIAPTPAAAYLCTVTDAAAGISISASHNPFEDNGVKIFGHDGMKLPDSIEEQIEEEMLAIRKETVPAYEETLDEHPELVERYEQFLLSCVGPDALRGKHVVIDTGHGAAYRIGPEAFRRCGARVTVIHDQPNGRNINEKSGALHPDAMARKVVEVSADFGVAFDGDADRAIFSDDRGKIRDGDEIIFLWAQRLRREGKLKDDSIVTTVMSNFGFERELVAQGMKLYRAAVGDKYVLEMMIAKGVVIGGEQSGHIIDRSVHTTGDGIHTALAFGELLALSDEPFSALRTFEPMPQILINEKVAAKPSLDALPAYQAAAREANDQLHGSGRILVRYSGTENLVRVMVEGEDRTKIEKIAGHLRDVLRDEIAASVA